MIFSSIYCYGNESQVERIVLWGSSVHSGCIMHILANIVFRCSVYTKVCDCVPHAFWILLRNTESLELYYSESDHTFSFYNLLDCLKI